MELGGPYVEINVTDAAFGQAATNSLVAAGVTGNAMKGLVKDTDNFAKSVAASIDKATSPFQSFPKNITVTADTMRAFFATSNATAAAWSDEFTNDIKAGLNQGLVQEIAKAGPDAKDKLDAITQIIQQGGLSWINSMEQSAQDMQKPIDDAYNNMAITAAIKSADQAQVVKAAMADAASGGHANLLKLVNSSNTDLAQMAYAFAIFTSHATDSINSVPTSHDTQFTANADAINRAVFQAQLALSQLPNVVGITIAGNMALPHAAGGVFTTPHIGLVAEDGPEAILPLNDPARAMQILSQTGLGAGGSAAPQGPMTSGGGTVVNAEIHNHGVTGDSAVAEATAREIAWMMKTK
jgi:hypothetical protein